MGFCSGLSGYDHTPYKWTRRRNAQRLAFSSWRSPGRTLSAWVCWFWQLFLLGDCGLSAIWSSFSQISFFRDTHGAAPSSLSFPPRPPSLAHRNPHEKDGFLLPCCLVSMGPVVWFPWGPLWPVSRPVDFLRRWAAHLQLRDSSRGNRARTHFTCGPGHTALALGLPLVAEKPKTAGS